MGIVAGLGGLALAVMSVGMPDACGLGSNAVVGPAAELDSMEGVSLIYKGSTGWIQMADAQVDAEDEIVTGTIMFASSISVDAR